MKKLVTLLLATVLTFGAIFAPSTIEMNVKAAQENYEPPKENPTIPNGVLPVEEYEALTREKGLLDDIEPEGTLVLTYLYMFEEDKGIHLETKEIYNPDEFFEVGDVVLEAEDIVYDEEGWVSSSYNYFVVDHVEPVRELPNTFKTAKKLLGENGIDAISTSKFKEKKKLNELEKHGMIALASEWFKGNTMYKYLDYDDIYMNISKKKPKTKNLYSLKKGYELWDGSDYKLVSMYVAKNGDVFGNVTCKGKLICRVCLADL